MTISVTPYIDLARELMAGYTPRRVPAPADSRPAAVLALLFHDQGEDRVLLTRRTDTVEHHKGQISFPGGGVLRPYVPSVGGRGYGPAQRPPVSGMIIPGSVSRLQCG